MLHEQDRKPPQFVEAMQQCLSGILLELFRIVVNTNHTQSVQADKNSENRAAEVLEYITEHFYESQSLAEAAKMANLSQYVYLLMHRLTNGLIPALNSGMPVA